MRSNRMKNTSPPRRKRSAVKRVKPQRGTLPLLIVLSVFVVLMVLFAPKIAQTPAANVSGTEIEAEAVSSGNTNLRVTEAMSSNRSAFPDETGAFPDWVELTNTGDSPINIKGYGLSDRADKITFVFPDMTLAAGEHVIVFASDSTQNEAGKALHAKFKLSSAGDKLFLFGSDGIAFQELDIPAMDSNMSYMGRRQRLHHHRPIHAGLRQHAGGLRRVPREHGAAKRRAGHQRNLRVLHHHAQGRRRRLPRLDRDPQHDQSGDRPFPTTRSATARISSSSGASRRAA